MADWLDQPLSVLGNNPSLVTARHEKITQGERSLHCEWLHAQPAGDL